MSLDRMIHDPSRLAILCVLYSVGKANFVQLQKYCVFTRGNLSSHLAKLRAAGYVSIEKKFKGNIPVTVCALTKKGLDAFGDYAENLKAVRPAGQIKRAGKAEEQE